MINIEKARQELTQHAKKQETENFRVSRKLDHILRVAKISKKLATKLELTEEQIQLAELIGLLHDIGRFQQYQLFHANTSSIVLDTTTQYNHGEAGVEILKKDNYIRKYIQDPKYDEIILTAVYEHNRYQITEGLTKEKELFSKIIRDADKLDIFYEAIFVYWQKPEDIQEIEKGALSPKMLEDFYQHKLADNQNRTSRTDQILRFASFLFDINFSCTLEEIKQKNYITSMIDRFHYQLPETKQEMEKVKEIANGELRDAP